MSSFFKSIGKLTGSSPSSSDTPPPQPQKPAKKVLVIVSGGKKGSSNWAEIFSTKQLSDGTPVLAYAAQWEDINCTAYGESKTPCVVDIFDRKENRIKCITPDIILVRAEVRGFTHGVDHRNILYAFRFGQVPLINSATALIQMMDRPWLHAELIAIRDRVGPDKFPLINQTYYPNHKDMLITPGYPLVVKLGHAHAGFGKMKLYDHKQFEDFKSVVATTNQYCTAEPFMEGVFDVRVQRIGKNVRAFERRAMAGQWKTNTGSADLRDVPVTEEFKFWADQVESLFGGLDIFTVDAIATWKDKSKVPEDFSMNPDAPIDYSNIKYYILEVNGSSSGFSPYKQDEDDLLVRDLVLSKLEPPQEQKT
eukprot:TRINITY_DN8789_c0_g1_i1.p1 TRINITY_DN8789_c0_g1~~TRINITY_DN8789_c0_g1_i1.p1  ORF type:complete len:365 (-),score=105.48 TRINITY_DN8789_c0_g1_i1:42-1136(-)